MLELLKSRRRAGAEKGSAAGAELRPSADVLTAERDGLAVLLDLRREVYVGLDEVGTVIWRCVGEGASATRISERVAAEFDAAPEVVAEDVRAFLTDLGRRGLVEVS